MGEPKFCRRCHQPVRPSEPQANFVNGDVEHAHCFLGDQREGVSSLASPSPEPDAPLPLSLEKVVEIGRRLDVTLDEWWIYKTERLPLVKTALAAHDLQAANAELREKHDGDLNELHAKLTEVYATVSRIWGALGISTYEQSGGKEISELVAELRARAEKAEAECHEARVKALQLLRERDEARAERDEWRESYYAAQKLLHGDGWPFREALAELREACARVAADIVDGPDSGGGLSIARTIRAIPLPAAAEEEKP